MNAILYYKRWPTPEQLRKDFDISHDEAELMLLQLRVLFPTDKMSQLIYLNEYRHLIEEHTHPLYAMSSLMSVAKNRRYPEGVLWKRDYGTPITNNG
jgi:hypothetical protein